MFRTAESPVSVNDILEFRAAHMQLSREIGIEETERRMERIFEKAVELGNERAPLSTQLPSRIGQENVTVKIGEHLHINKKPGNGSFTDEARIIISNKKHQVLHDLCIQRETEGVWTVDYLDHIYTKGIHDYSWRRANERSSHFVAEQAYDRIPELKQIEEILGQTRIS